MTQYSKRPEIPKIPHKNLGCSNRRCMNYQHNRVLNRDNQVRLFVNQGLMSKEVGEYVKRFEDPFSVGRIHVTIEDIIRTSGHVIALLELFDAVSNRAFTSLMLGAYEPNNCEAVYYWLALDHSMGRLSRQKFLSWFFKPHIGKEARKILQMALDVYDNNRGKGPLNNVD